MESARLGCVWRGTVDVLRVHRWHLFGSVSPPKKMHKKTVLRCVCAHVVHTPGQLTVFHSENYIHSNCTSCINHIFIVISNLLFYCSVALLPGQIPAYIVHLAK